MDRHITWNVMWRSDGFPISDWVSLDVFTFLNSVCVTRCTLAWPHILLNLFFFLPGCGESLSIPDKLYAAPRLFHNYLGDKRKTNKQHKNALIFHVSSIRLMVYKKGKNRSWSFCKSWKPMTCSSKKWTLISNRTAEERDSKPSVTRVTISNVWKRFRQTSIQKIFS